jgi:hypothetical protein
MLVFRQSRLRAAELFPSSWNRGTQRPSFATKKFETTCRFHLQM